MAQYNQTTDQLLGEDGSIGSSDIDDTTQQAISDLLAGLGTVVIDDDPVVIASDVVPDIIQVSGGEVGDVASPVIISGGSNPLVVDITSATSVDVDGDGRTDSGGERAIVGGDGDDSISIQGGDVATIDAGGGDDSISTGGGADVVSGGAGDDSVSTGAGADSVTVGEGSDSVDTGSGFDIVSTDQDFDPGNFEVTADGTVVITNFDTGEQTTVDNAEYIEFGDGTGHLVAGDNNDDILEDVLGDAGNLEALLLASEGVSAADLGNLSTLIGNYLDSEEYQNAQAGGLTDISDLVELVYEGALGIDIAPATLELLIESAKDELSQPSEDLNDLLEGLEAAARSSISDIDIGEI